MNLNLLRTLNMSCGIALILAVNVVGALPKTYKGIQHPVGPGLVSVYTQDDDSDAQPVPVQAWGGYEAGFKDTGQRVTVYLFNGYKDDEIEFYPRRTILIAICMVVIHLVLKVIPSKPRPKPEMNSG